MVRCWIISEHESENELVKKEIDVQEAVKATGIEYFYIDPNDYRSEVDRISAMYSYKREDVIDVKPDCLENFQEMTIKFKTEHHHPDEEVRFALKGKGCFDVRSKDDVWVRVEVTPGDFLILPPGIYHRFQVHERETGIRFLRLFRDDEPYRIMFRKEDQPQAVC